METKKVDVAEIIDSASFIGKPLGIAVMMIIIMLTDGFDLFIPSYIAPALVDDWQVSKADVQPFVQAGLIGMAIGSVILGWIGDRIGRIGIGHSRGERGALIDLGRHLRPRLQRAWSPPPPKKSGSRLGPVFLREGVSPNVAILNNHIALKINPRPT